ncbi:hypothetical protein Fcan01_00635 [Folsomia candida]|uniref:Uncharacterized protein n=1 Tax=Folsomia candida TaxID=158441 RepID=A0A226F2H3_FOLCA|nr:hypothetical protein Fcan01_00635 [Folsomia candida]
MSHFSRTTPQMPMAASTSSSHRIQVPLPNPAGTATTSRATIRQLQAMLERRGHHIKRVEAPSQQACQEEDRAFCEWLIGQGTSGLEKVFNEVKDVSCGAGQQQQGQSQQQIYRGYETSQHTYSQNWPQVRNSSTVMRPQQQQEPNYDNSNHIGIADAVNFSINL